MGVSKLSVQGLLQVARERAGLTDFGNEDFLEALSAYIEALKETAETFSEQGSVRIFEELVGALVNRLATTDYISRNPQVEQETISRPIFITGLYRTATTKLQNLLCADPRWLHLQTWQTMRPAPLPGTRLGEEDPRIAASRLGMEHLRRVAPHAALAHPLEATDPSEEFPLMTQSFRLMDAKQVNPNFANWIAAHDSAPMYRDLHRALQVLQHQFKRSEQAEQRYCLKAPSHLGNIETLMKVFPDAKIIFMHRDPFPAIHSFTMVRDSLRSMYTDHVDREALGAQILEQAASALDKSVLARAKFPQGAFLDLRFEDIVRRALEQVPGIYRYVDAPLGPSVLAALAQADEKRDEHKSRADWQDPVCYGLSRARVHERSRDYLAWAREHVGALD